jgi:hypothetical protein
MPDMRVSIPTPFPKSYWVIPGRLLAGAYPGAKDPAEAAGKLKALFDAGIAPPPLTWTAPPASLGVH